VRGSGEGECKRDIDLWVNKLSKKIIDQLNEERKRNE
jgi:hypothetical protein